MRYFTIIGGFVEVLGIVITGWGLFYAWRRLGTRIWLPHGRTRPIDQTVHGTDQGTATEDQIVLKKFQLNTSEPIAAQVDSLYKQITDTAVGACHETIAPYDFLDSQPACIPTRSDHRPRRRHRTRRNGRTTHLPVISVPVTKHAPP